MEKQENAMMEKKATLCGLLAGMAFCQMTELSAASLWTCQATAKVKTVAPVKTRSTVKQSAEFEFLDDGTVLEDNHAVPYKIPGTYYLQGKTAYFYPDRDTVIQSIYDTVPGVSNVMVLSNYLTFKFDKRMPKATKASLTGYADEQFVNANGVFVRAVVNGKGKCTRLR